ncbi:MULTISPECIES: DUF2004 domain-containing protein [Arthrobacter]|uniref:DUF2004 domain-containing protein n=2 Tax=Arthrobacter TaxID=1663 RepID=A0ABU9KGZ0_9MICC|nr:DUF2004 domain-containing protein [Arthrobacter sp. YJM1]MDP5226159.1 DUF2004 domain-containing protein [Arthrobacter sp. YJM1]
MSTVISEHFGELELNHGAAHCFTANHAVHGVPVEIELNFAAHERPDQASVHKADYRLHYLPELVDQVREMIIQELGIEGSQVQEYRRFHCQGLDPEKQWNTFGVTGEVDDDAFVRALRLGHVGIFPDQPERYFVLDFSLGEHFSDETLVATADADGVVDDEINWS